MKISDRFLLLAIAAVLLLMVGLVLHATPSGDLPSGNSALEGEPRTVDVDLLRRRMIRGELSDHEALYYR